MFEFIPNFKVSQVIEVNKINSIEIERFMNLSFYDFGLETSVLIVRICLFINIKNNFCFNLIIIH